MEKTFSLSRDDVNEQLAPNRGVCIATDMITVGGRQVGYMYREEPHMDGDSGWRFMAGCESQEYMDEPANSMFYDINTIANYDPDIIDLLAAPIGASFERLTTDGDLVPADCDLPAT